MVATASKMLNLTAIRAKVVHNRVLAVSRLGDFSRCACDFDIGVMSDEVVSVC